MPRVSLPLLVLSEDRASAFARAVGAARVDDVVDPVLVAALALPAVTALLVEPALALSLLRVTHDAHALRVHDAVRVGDELTCDAEVTGADRTGGGAIVTARVCVRTARGLAQEATATITARPSRAGRGPLPTPSPAPTAWRQGDVVIAARVADACAAIGDENPVYADVDVARLAGLPAPMAPWLLALAIAGRHAAVRTPWTTARATWTWPLLHDDAIVVAGGDNGEVVVDNGAGRRVVSASFSR